MLLDIDYFILFNDNYGHQMGDECLKEVAQLLNKACFNPNDTPARYGGEEFVVILPLTSEKNALKVAERFFELLETAKIEHKFSKVADQITVSIGIATCCTERTYDVKQIIEEADKALYRAKENGRNRIEKASEN